MMMGENVDMKTIKEAVTIFRNSDKIKAAVESNVEYKKMVKQIDKYWEKLFGRSNHGYNCKWEKRF